MRVLIALLAVAALAGGCGDDGRKPVQSPTPDNARPDAGARKPGGPKVVMADDSPRFVFEAEAATSLVAPFQTMEDSEASGGKCLTLPSKGCNGVHHQHIAEEGTPERTAGSAELAFNVPADGDYYLLIRMWPCCSCGNSFAVSIDGGKPFVFGEESSTNKHWSWIKAQEAGDARKFKLTAGDHKLVFKNRGESGFRIDQLIWTTSASFVPQGQEKPQAASK